MKTLTAVLFAGGESRRMGVEKATLEINGVPLWSRQLRMLQELKPERILVSARQRPAWCPPEIEVVEDEPPSRGPLSGLAAAWKLVETSHVLALAMDLPLMQTSFLRALWEGAQPGKGMVPAHENYAEPLCAVYPLAIGSTLVGALAQEDVSLQRLVRVWRELGLVEIAAVNATERELFYNLNDRTDFDRINRIH